MGQAHLWPPPGDSRQRLLQPPLLTLQGWLGTAGGNVVRGWRTGPVYGPLLPGPPASGGARAVLTGNTFSGLPKAAWPIYPGQRWDGSRPCSFRRELKPEIGEDSAEVPGSGWTRTPHAASPVLSPSALACLPSGSGLGGLHPDLLYWTASGPRCYKVLGLDPSWAVAPESRNVACLQASESPGVCRRCLVSAGGGVAWQPC